jgi:hypothetical protein
LPLRKAVRATLGEKCFDELAAPFQRPAGI